MRKMVFPLLLLAGSLLIFSGCVSRTGSPADGGAGDESRISTVREVEEVQLVSRELSYYPDGVLASYRIYTYAEEGTEKLEEALYNSDDEMIERLIFKYEDGNQRSKQTYEGFGELLQTYDGNGELLNYHAFKYDDDGQMTEDALYNGKDELQTRQEFEYDRRGNKVKWSVFSGDGALLSYTTYEYEEGLNTLIENHGPDGDVPDYFQLEYDQAGRLVKRTWYTGDDQVEQVHVYVYEGDSLAEERILRGNGSVKRRILYTNNSYGYPVEVVYMDGGNKVREIKGYEYVTRTRITYRQVKE